MTNIVITNQSSTVPSPRSLLLGRRNRAVSVSDQKRIKKIFYDAWHFSGRSYLCRKRIGGCFQAWFENRNEICLSRSEEHTSELQSRGQLLCRLMQEIKNKRA